jgi:hypothetical protein
MLRLISRIDIDNAFDLLTLAFLVCLFGGAIAMTLSM